jgi:hypothetical protein
MNNERLNMNYKTKNFFAKILTVAVIAVSVFQFGSLPALAATFTATGISDVMSRDQVNITGVTHSVSMTLPSGGPFSGTLILTNANFTGFAGTATGSCAGGTVTGTSSSANVETVTLGGSGCSAGALTITNFTGTNPSGAGSNTVTLTGTANIVGSFAVTTVTLDQVTVSATVNPTITFNVGTQASGTACSGSYSGNGGTVGLGTLTTGAVATSENGSINNICSRLTTNAGTGAVVTVQSLNSGLKSGSDTIASATATLVAGTSGYGVCDSSIGGSSETGKDSTTPISASPTAVGTFASSCTASAHSVGALTSSPQTIWNVSAASSNAYYKILVKAAISGTVPAHSDYADTLTFIATGTF